MSWFSAARRLKLGKFLRNFWFKFLTILDQHLICAKFGRVFQVFGVRHSPLCILCDSSSNPGARRSRFLFSHRRVSCSFCWALDWSHKGLLYARTVMITYFLCNWIGQVTLWKHMHAFWCKPIICRLFFWRKVFCLPLTAEPEPKYWTDL